MRQEQRKWWKFACLLMGVGGICVVVRTVGLSWSSVTPQSVRAVVLAWGWWSLLVYMILYAQPIIPLPASVMSMAGGLSFGLVGGFVAAVVAATIRGCGQFLIARLLGREAVEGLLKGRLATWDQQVGRHGFQTVLWIRLVPNVPYDVQNFSLGFSSVLFSSFVLATVLGIIPSMFLWVYLGHTVTDARQLWRVVVLLVSVTALWWFQRRVRRPS